MKAYNDMMKLIKDHFGTDLRSGTIYNGWKLHRNVGKDMFVFDFQEDTASANAPTKICIRFFDDALQTCLFHSGEGVYDGRSVSLHFTDPQIVPAYIEDVYKQFEDIISRPLPSDILMKTKELLMKIANGTSETHTYEAADTTPYYRYNTPYRMRTFINLDSSTSVTLDCGPNTRGIYWTSGEYRYVVTFSPVEGMLMFLKRYFEDVEDYGTALRDMLDDLKERIPDGSSDYLEDIDAVVWRERCIFS